MKTAQLCHGIAQMISIANFKSEQTCSLPSSYMAWVMRVTSPSNNTYEEAIILRCR